MSNSIIVVGRQGSGKTTFVENNIDKSIYRIVDDTTLSYAKAITSMSKNKDILYCFIIQGDGKPDPAGNRRFTIMHIRNKKLVSTTHPDTDN